MSRKFNTPPGMLGPARYPHPICLRAHNAHLCAKQTNCGSVEARRDEAPSDRGSPNARRGRPSAESAPSMLLERDLIQSVGFRNVREDGSITGFQLRLRMPSYRGMTASLIDGVAVRVGDLVDVAADVPLWTLQGKTYTLAGAVGRRRRALAARRRRDRHRAASRGPARRRARGVDRAAAADVVHPGRAPALDLHRHQARHPLARGDGAPFKYGVSPLQLHDRLRHRARPRDRDGRHRRHRRDRHRDPRRGAHPELPEPVAGVGGRLVPPAREVRPRAHQLRLVDRHPPALQRPERPRHDRRGGRRGAAARPAAREAARLPVRPARRSAWSRATWCRTRSGPRSSSAACRWPKSST